MYYCSFQISLWMSSLKNKKGHYLVNCAVARAVLGSADFSGVCAGRSRRPDLARPPDLLTDFKHNMFWFVTLEKSYTGTSVFRGGIKGDGPPPNNLTKKNKKRSKINVT